MYDMSAKFNAFYSSCVVLPQDEQNNLYEKKDLNIQRLKDGLTEYNKENGTFYDIEEVCVQGSIAMSTVVQNENNDYDIDVAVVFNSSDLGDMGAQATRNMVANALKRKTRQFNTEPEVKTSCVRVKYSDGYHIDFAVYRRWWDHTKSCWRYEHAGAEWSERDLKGLSGWFKARNDLSGGKLRKTVRLSKMFCNSRDSWVNMPSGLLQTVLCDEKLQQDYSRIDELFYYTMKEIVARLDSDTVVLAPVDGNRLLTPRQSDIKKMTNWKNRLKSKLEDLDVLFKKDCTEEDALQVWYGFFDHEYWREQLDEKASRKAVSTFRISEVQTYDDTEEFIDDLFPVKRNHTVTILCIVSGDGWRPQPLSSYLSLLRKFLPHHFEIRCSILSTTVSEPYDVYWKVKNAGPEAERRNMLRGQIKKLKKNVPLVEHSLFYGNHYIECYIVKDDVCVAKNRIDIPIGR